MCTASKKIVFLFCIYNLITPFLYAQNDAIPFTIMPLPVPIIEKEPLKDILQSALPPPSEINATENVNKTTLSFPAYLIPTRQSIAFMQSYGRINEAFLDFIDKRVYEDSFREKEEKRLIREQWKQYFGLDIWYPYFKAKEIEDWISDSTKVELFHFKGRMKFENNQIKYTFKGRF